MCNFLFSSAYGSLDFHLLGSSEHSQQPEGPGISRSLHAQGGARSPSWFPRTKGQAESG